MLVSYRPLANLSVVKSYAGCPSGEQTIGRFILAVSCSLRQDGQTCGCLVLGSLSSPACYLCEPRMSDSDSLESYERPPLPAIHDAVQNLDVDGVRRELAAGANVDVLDEEGYTPLYYACKATSIAKAIREEKVRERDAIVAALLRAGANVEGRPSTYSFTPLLGAVWDRRGPPSDVVAQLIAAGADVEASDNYFHVLYVAAQHGRGDTVSRLLAAGADPHRRSSNDHALTALHGATLTCNSHAYPPLLRAGAALPELDRRDAYLDKIAATPGGFPAYEREHRRRLTAVFANKFPMLPVEVISHIVLLWGHCGDYLYSDTAPPAPAPPAPAPPAESLLARRRKRGITRVM